MLYTLSTLPSSLDWRLPWCSPWCNQPTGLKTSGLPHLNQTVQTRKHTVWLSCSVSLRRFFFLVVFQNLKTPKWTVWVFFLIFRHNLVHNCLSNCMFGVFNNITFATWRGCHASHRPLSVPAPVLRKIHGLQGQHPMFYWTSACCRTHVDLPDVCRE